jgi:hypothetical protein
MDLDKEDSMEAMIPTMPTMSLGSYQNRKLPLPSKTTENYSALLENDENNYFDGILTAEAMQNGSNISHLAATTSSSKSNTVLAMKRTLPSQFWNETGSIVGSSSGNNKRFHGDLNNSGSSAGLDENNSFVSLLNQLPQGHAHPFHPNSLLGSLGDGVLRQQFHLPSMNWNS